MTLVLSSKAARTSSYHLGGGARGRYHSRSTKRSSSLSHGPDAGLLGMSSIAKVLLGASGGGRALRSHSSSFMRLRLARRMSSLRPTSRATSSCQECQTCWAIQIPSSQSATYIFQVGDNIEEIVCLFKLVAGFRDSIFHHQVFGDFGPHALSGIFHATISTSNLTSSSRGRSWGWSANLAAVAFIATIRHEFAPSHPIVPLPSDLLGAPTGSVHPDTSSPRWHIYDSPISS